MLLKQQTSQIKAYGMEALGLFGFVLIAGLMAIFLEHPDMPVMQTSWKHEPLLRRIPLGIVLGLYIFIISKAFGKKSGAMVNPAVTWAMYRQGNINFKDAIWYTVAQFVGAVVAAQLLKWTLFTWFGHPNIHFGITKPIPPHESENAWMAEFLISFITMAIILFFSSLKKLEKLLPVAMAVSIALFLIFELPYSGMSMNPARSFAGALAAGKWEHLWLYFAAPIPA
ncbi:MAG: aquaporin family protein, partial [Sphingobacteriaceae bacterium]